jgi:drug/metabolite transporter (DMT)-like permease
MWIFLSLVSAFFTATTAALSKLALKDNDEYTVGWIRCIISVPIFLSLLFFIKVPRLDATFFYIILILLPLETIAYLFYLKALKLSPLSLIIPFMALTPVFMIFTTRLILGEQILPMGIAGILFVFTGAYILNLKTHKDGFLGPIKSILREKGSIYMIIVAFIYSITAILGKLAMDHSSPMFMVALYFPAVTILLTPIMIIRYGRGGIDLNKIKSQKILFISIGVLFSVTVLVHFIALNMTSAAYIIALKRLSMVFGIVYGWLLFKEQHIISRLLGAGVMIAGVILISLAQ